MTRKTFHHGDLRSASLKEASAALNENGYEAVSMREIAKQLGVAHSALYRHFASKEALLYELATEGIAELREHYSQITAMQCSAQKRLIEACRAYLNFADTHSGLYQLIYTSDIFWSKVEIDITKPDAPFSMFESLVAEIINVTDVQLLRAQAVALWCPLHGYAMLQTSHQLANLSDTSLTRQSVMDAVEKLIEDLEKQK